MKLIVLKLLLLLPLNAFACLHQGYSVNTLYRDSDIIFVGEVVDVQAFDNRVKGVYLKASTPTVAVFRPKEIFKAGSTRQNTAREHPDIFILRGTTNCYYSFTKGKEYLVAAKRLMYGAEIFKTSLGKVLEISESKEAINKLRLLRSAHEELDNVYEQTKNQ